MYAFVRPFIDLCLMRRRPQDLPPSSLLLTLTLVAHTMTGVFASLQLLSPGSALLAGITGTLLLCAMAAMLLALQRHLERLTQTLTALAGSLALLDLIALPITSWWQQVHDSGVANPLPALLLLAVLGWNLGVVGHVLRHALGIAWFMGIAIALAFYLLFMDVMNTLFPFNG